MFEKLCGCIWNSILSVIHPSDLWHFFYFMSHITESHHASLTHVTYNSCLTLKLQMNYIFLSIFFSACQLVFIFIYIFFYLCPILSLWVGLIFRGVLRCHCLHLWVERAPCWTCIYFLLACNVNEKQSFFGL